MGRSILAYFKLENNQEYPEKINSPILAQL